MTEFEHKYLLLVERLVKELQLLNMTLSDSLCNSEEDLTEDFSVEDSD